MSRIFIFSDEAGCFSFARNNRASKFFLVCTVSMDSCEIGNGLLELRRDMAWRGLPVGEAFHATEDPQAVRDEVFQYLAQYEFRVDATLLEKSKAQPHTRNSPERFYQYAWFYHFRHVGPKIMRGKSEVLITAASIGTKKGQAAYTAAVNDVMQQTVRNQQWKTVFPRAACDPCLQIADYCAWAIQRKWERADNRSFALIEDKVVSEYDLWRTGTRHYY